MQPQAESLRLHKILLGLRLILNAAKVRSFEPLNFSNPTRVVGTPSCRHKGNIDDRVAPHVPVREPLRFRNYLFDGNLYQGAGGPDGQGGGPHYPGITFKPGRQDL